MAKVNTARITALRAQFEAGDYITQVSCYDLIDALAEAAQEHDHVATGGPGTGTGDAGAVTNLASGLDAEKPVTPAMGDVYVATNTTTVYVAFAVGVWTAIN